MNKLFTKVATLSIGLAMAIGVGVAVGSNEKEARVEASAGDKANSKNFSKTAEYYICGAQSSTDSTVWYLSGSTSGYVDQNASWGVCTTDSSKAMRFTIDGSTVTSGKTSITVKSTTKYGTKQVYVEGLTTGKFKFSTTSTSIAIDENGKIYNSTSGSYLLRHNYNSGNGGLRWYSSSTGTLVYLVEAPAISTDPEISVSCSSLEVIENDSNGATFTVSYANTETDFVITSSDTNEDYVMLDYTSGHGTSGEATITVYGLKMTSEPVVLTITQDGVEDELEVSVTVKSDNEVSITADGGAISLKQGATLQLSASSSKDGETPTDTFTWTTSDANVATVSNSGLVTGVAEGSATIKAESNLYAGTFATKELTVTFGSDQSIASFYSVDDLTNGNGSSASGDYVKGVFSGGSTVISSVSTYKANYNKFGGLSMGTGKYEGYVIITMNDSYKLKSVSIWAACVDATVTEPTVLYGTGDTAETAATKMSNNAKIFGKSEVLDENAVPFTYTFASDAKIIKLHSTSETAKWTIYKIILCWTNVEASSLTFDVGSSFSLMNTITKTLKINAVPLYYNVALGVLTWNSSNTDVATVTSAGLVEAKANSGTSTITATTSGKTATTVVHAISKVASSVTIDASVVSSGSTADINGVSWEFLNAARYGNDYTTKDGLQAYTRGCILLDTGYIQNSTAAFFKIKKVIVALCLAANKTSGYDASLTVCGSNTSAGGDDISSTSSTSGILKTYTLSEGCDYVKISSSGKVDFNSITIEYATPEETIVSVAEFIIGLQPDRGEESIGYCTINNGTYYAAKGRMAKLDADAREEFQTSQDLTVSAARTRYNIWAANNHDASPYDGSTSVSQNSRIALDGIVTSNSTTLIIIVASVVSLAAIGGYFLFKKKKQ